MKKLMITLLGAAVMLIAVPETMAGHHGRCRDKGNDGLRLAAGIVNLVKEVIAPAPQAVCAAAPRVVYTPPATVIVPPRHNYRRPEPPRHHMHKPHKIQPKPQPKRGGHRR